MTEQIRLRLDGGLVQEASALCRRLGMTPATAVSMFFSQMVKLGGLPFRPADYPALDEYGVTAQQALAAEDTALAEIKKARKARQLTAFTGKL